MKTKTSIVLACLLGTVCLGAAAAQSPADPAEAMRKRITEKVGHVQEGVQEGVHAWAASGRDPSGVVKTLQETIKPLLDAGKALEAETELDRLLEHFKSDAKPPSGRPPDPVHWPVWF